jgi:hypothetical protein
MNDETIAKTNNCLLITLGIPLFTASTVGWILVALTLFRNFMNRVGIFDEKAPLLISLAIAIIPIYIFSNLKERLS